MAKWRTIRNQRTGRVVLERAKVCSTFWSHFKGLQLSRRLPEGEGLIFTTGKEGRSHTAIHMFFVFFSIGVIWLDASGRVVDVRLAKPWRPYYAPVAPARDFIEALPSVLERVRVGDQLVIVESS